MFAYSRRHVLQSLDMSVDHDCPQVWFHPWIHSKMFLSSTSCSVIPLSFKSSATPFCHLGLPLDLNLVLLSSCCHACGTCAWNISALFSYWHPLHFPSCYARLRSSWALMFLFMGRKIFLSILRSSFAIQMYKWSILRYRGSLNNI